MIFVWLYYYYYSHICCYENILSNVNIKQYNYQQQLYVLPIEKQSKNVIF